MHAYMEQCECMDSGHLTVVIHLSEQHWTVHWLHVMDWCIRDYQKGTPSICFSSGVLLVLLLSQLLLTPLLRMSLFVFFVFRVIVL